VVIAIDQDTMDNVIGPMMFKATQHNQHTETTTPQQAAPPDNNGM
jgi:hypothetical protein